MEYAIRLVSQRGGAMAVINEEGGNFTRRFLVENLVVHDIFSKSVHPRPLQTGYMLDGAFFRSCSRLLRDKQRARAAGQVRSVVVRMPGDVQDKMGMGIGRKDVSIRLEDLRGLMYPNLIVLYFCRFGVSRGMIDLLARASIRDLHLGLRA
jgi:hypothetical protein